MADPPHRQFISQIYRGPYGRTGNEWALGSVEEDEPTEIIGFCFYNDQMRWRDYNVEGPYIGREQ